jgi:hypothetical protein
MIDFIVHHFILFSIIFFVLGFLLARNTKPLTHQEEKIESFFDKENKISKQDKKQKNTTIDIDESVHVVNINTATLEKKYESIGNTKSTKEDISSGISKLKNMKK